MSDTLLPPSKISPPLDTEPQAVSLSRHSPHLESKPPVTSLNQSHLDLRPSSRTPQAVAPEKKRKRKDGNTRGTLLTSGMLQYKHDQGRNFTLIDSDEDVREPSPTVIRSTSTMPPSRSSQLPPSTSISFTEPDVNTFHHGNDNAPTNATDPLPLWLLDSASLISFGEGTRDEPRQANGKLSGPVKTPLARFKESFEEKRKSRLAASG